MNSTTSIIIADDHAVLRAGLVAYLTHHAGFNLLAAVGDAEAAVIACAAHQPAILLLDLEMAGRDAIAAIADIRRGSPATRVVILTAHCRDSFIELAIRAGVSGYLLKSDTPEQIQRALMQVADGGRAFSQAVASRLANNGAPVAQARPTESIIRRLTQREIEVLRYIGRGWSNERMADEMHLSKRTVERRVARLMSSAAIRDRAGLIRLAYEQGLVV